MDYLHKMNKKKTFFESTLDPTVNSKQFAVRKQHKNPESTRLTVGSESTVRIVHELQLRRKEVYKNDDKKSR